MPLMDPTDATEGLALVHKPPAIELPREVVLPVHTVGMPERTGTGLTVTEAVETQPANVV